LVQRIDSVAEQMSPLLKSPLVTPLTDRLDTALQPGADTVGWLSTTAPEFLLRAGDAVGDWELTVRRATELVDQRILAKFGDMETAVLCQLSPADEPFTAQQFVDYVRVG